MINNKKSATKENSWSKLSQSEMTDISSLSQVLKPPPKNEKKPNIQIMVEEPGHHDDTYTCLRCQCKTRDGNICGQCRQDDSRPAEIY